jgi:hypothetical protein
MTNHPRLPVLVAVTALVCHAAGSRADDMKDLSPLVASVVTGGEWKHDNQEGRYRLVVRTAGFEHIRSTIRVEWIVVDPDRQESRVLASVPVDSIPDWAWSLGPPKLTCSHHRCQFTIDGSTEGADSLIENARWRVVLKEPRQLIATREK